MEWLSDVPEHWEVRPLQWILQETLKYGANEAADLDDQDLPRYIRITDITPSGQLRDETFRSLPVEVAAPYLLQEGDLLFARSGSVGRTFLYKRTWGLCAHAGYLIRARLDAEIAMPAFIFYYSLSHSYTSWLRTQVIQSTIENVNAERYSSMPIPLPPLPEQHAIAGFLDRETGRVDVLVEKKKELIERLAEYRTALITQTVTKGLPPDVAAAEGFNPAPPLKPSGVEWLGDVPEHWKVKRLHRICQLAYGDSLPTDSRQTGEFPVLGSNGTVGYHRETNTLAPVIVVGRKGSHGQVNFNYGPIFAIDTTFFIDRRSTDAELRWLYFSLLCIELDEESMDSAVPGLSRQYAYKKYLALPPLEEQCAIAAFLDSQTGRIDALLARVEIAIERLREYRTALITAAVTGKIDVREGSLV
ncbi:MAG: restriction endonuclease subunit S [bacterium]|nr:restriction endonuclease subunit S [bacterium]